MRRAFAPPTRGKREARLGPFCFVEPRPDPRPPGPFPALWVLNIGPAHSLKTPPLPKPHPHSQGLFSFFFSPFSFSLLWFCFTFKLLFHLYFYFYILSNISVSFLV